MKQERANDHARLIADHAPDLLWEIDADGRILFVSGSCVALLGVPAEALVGRKVDTQFATRLDPGEDDPEALVQDFERRLRASGSQGLIHAYPQLGGAWRWFESRIHGFEGPDGDRRAIVITRDVTERQAALHEILQNEARFRNLAEVSRDFVTETDSNGRFSYVNTSCEKLLGYAPGELIGESAVGIVHPEDVEGFLDGLRESARSPQSIAVPVHRIRHRDGSWIWVEATGIRYRRRDGELRTLGVARDITARIEAFLEREKLERRVQQTQRLESLGILAGGVAHDFNNLLTPILGNAALVLPELPEDSPLRPHIEKIVQAAQRAAVLTGQMLMYAGERAVELEVCDLSQIVQEISELLESVATPSQTLTLDLEPDLPLVEGEPGQLSQVVLNLITNACEALEGDTGTVTIRTETVEVDRARLDRAALGDERPEGRYVCFEVTDDGCGMTVETRERLFEPFYTTKFTGRGLGLAAVLGIVRGHGGIVEIKSDPGEGTRFRVLVPALEGAQMRVDPAPHRPTPWQRTGTVLVVDDDDGVRDLAAYTLERVGFEVLVASNGQDGVDLFRKRADDIALVVLDRTMPGASGEEALAEMRTIDSSVNVLLVSGYSRESAAAGLASSGAGFLQKPFLPDALLAEVRRLIESQECAR